MDSYGLNEFIRVSIGTDEQMIKFMSILKSIMKTNDVKKINEITIVGPGLIGASLGLALKKKRISKKIVGIDKSKSNLNDALKTSQSTSKEHSLIQELEKVK